MKCSKDGCKASALKNDPAGLCFWHSPQTAEKRRQAGRRGGRRGKVELEAVAIDSINDVIQVLTESLNELRQAGSESITGKARAVGYLCSILIMAIERSELEQRVSKLEQQLLSQESLV